MATMINDALPLPTRQHKCSKDFGLNFESTLATTVPGLEITAIPPWLTKWVLSRFSDTGKSRAASITLRPSPRRRLMATLSAHSCQVSVRKRTFRLNSLKISGTLSVLFLTDRMFSNPARINRFGGLAWRSSFGCTSSCCRSLIGLVGGR